MPSLTTSVVCVGCSVEVCTVCIARFFHPQVALILRSCGHLDCDHPCLEKCVFFLHWLCLPRCPCVKGPFQPQQGTRWMLIDGDRRPRAHSFRFACTASELLRQIGDDFRQPEAGASQDQRAGGNSLLDALRNSGASSGGQRSLSPTPARRGF